MLKDTIRSTRLPVRTLGIFVTVALVSACVFFSFPQAFADFSSESTGQVIGVGRIQSSTVATPATTEAVTHFAAPAQLSTEPTEVVSQLAQPLDRGVVNAESVAENISYIKRFGEQDENGWFTTKASAYGPSSAGQFTALGTELTLTSMDVGIHINHIDLMGRYVEIMYGGVIVRTQIVDNGTMAPDGRLFDLQPGLCTAFGAETPEFGWGVRTVKWRFAD